MTSFEIYTTTLGKLGSGKVLDDYDFGILERARFTPFSEGGKAAVTVAVQDVTNKRPMRTRAELDEELKRLGVKA